LPGRDQPGLAICVRPGIAPSVTSGLAGHHDRAAPQRPGGHSRWLAG